LLHNRSANVATTPPSTAAIAPPTALSKRDPTAKAALAAGSATREDIEITDARPTGFVETRAWITENARRPRDNRAGVAPPMTTTREAEARTARMTKCRRVGGVCWTAETVDDSEVETPKEKVLLLTWL
jgi:hypothetical protein